MGVWELADGISTIKEICSRREPYGYKIRLQTDSKRNSER
jgi:hypothetical protein